MQVLVIGVDRDIHTDIHRDIHGDIHGDIDETRVIVGQHPIELVSLDVGAAAQPVQRLALGRADPIGTIQPLVGAPPD